MNILFVAPVAERGGVHVVLGDHASLNVQLWADRDQVAVQLRAPDGRALVFNAPAGEGKNDDIFRLTIDGAGRETVLVKHESNDRLLTWTADGDLLFSSDRRGSEDRGTPHHDHSSKPQYCWSGKP